MAIELNERIEPKAPARSLGRRLAAWRPRGRIRPRDRMFFTEQLALLLETGSSLHAALNALKAQSKNPAMTALVGGLAADVAEGRTFSHALSRRPDVFSRTYVNLIAASEEGGYMHQVLEQLLEMDAKREAMHRTLVSALTYPAFLTLFATAVVIFVLVVVFPKFGDLFASIQDQLPATTLILMRASGFLLAHWPWLLLGLGAALAGLHAWARSAPGCERLDGLKLAVPGLRTAFARLYLVQFLRVMSLSLGNGVPILDALHAAREVVRNRRFRRFIDRVEQRVREGGGLAHAFTESPFIPPIAAQMIHTGEESGHLPKVTARLADHYETEMTRHLQTFSRMAEPVLLLVMGAVVGVIVSSLILPIFKLSAAVHY